MSVIAWFRQSSGSPTLWKWITIPSMQIQNFVRVYQEKSDEELIHLAATPKQLTSEARLTLQGELSRRRIVVTEDSPVSQRDGESHDGVQVAVSQRVQQAERHGVADFVAETLRTYHADFWLYFKITAPAVIISTVAIITSRHEVRKIARHLPRGVELIAHQAEILKMGLINFSAWIVTWIAFSLMFGAVCMAVEQRAAGFSSSAWRSFSNIRERLGPFLRLSLLLLVLVLVAAAASVMFASGVFWVLHQWRVHTTGLLIRLVSYGLAYLAVLGVSRFFLAVPAVILDDCAVGQAMFRSAKLTEGKWMTLAALLAKSLVGGYVAAMCPFWLASIVPSGPAAWWFPWILTVASIIGVTVVEPTMFVGFALLYLKMSTPASATSKVLVNQLT